MTISGNSIKGVANALLSTGLAADQTRAEHVFVRRFIELDLDDAATAGTACAEKVVHIAPTSGEVISCTVAPGAAITADNTDKATFTLAKRTGAGGATTIASGDTSITGALVFTPIFITQALNITASAVKYALGDVLTMKVVKGGAGQAISSASKGLCHVSILIQEDT